jgi:isoleucyl-tRNA synthetase
MAVFDFRKIEERVLKFWREHDIFAKSLENRDKSKRFVFFEGPPTANGQPGIHHFIGRAFKDLFNRYKTMRGFYILRKAGWDTHGLPVEIEVEKQLGFKNKKDIENYGIAAFNKKAKQSVWKYKKEWEELTRRMGFWVDMDDPYVTYENKYIESLWAILKNIWDKKLLYRAHKVVPFCYRCGTPLSSHEVAQGYKTITDQSVYLKFKVKRGKDVVKGGDHILVWTTTPWTLPGNIALAVGKDIDYIIAEIEEDRYVVAKDLAAEVLGESFTKKADIKGSELIGIEYEPLFDVPKLKSEKSYCVYDADFVSTTEGTGVVHTAVMYGEDDYSLGTQFGLPKIHTVSETGKFVDVGKEFDGKYVKDPETDKAILDYLKKNGNLLSTKDYEHEYPFCWRCGLPLLYYAKSSWFIKMSAVRDKLIKNNQKINWIPGHIKEGRFGQWLKDVKDWAISRERYWATPLPIYECVKCDNSKLVGSFKEFRDSNTPSGNTYYIMRHGYSSRKEDTKMIIASRIESDTYYMTKEGKEQIEKSVKKLALVEDDIDFIYTSPFIRTKEAAELAGKMLHKNVQTDDRLLEIRHGLSCEGKSHTVCSFRDGRDDFDQNEGEGESYNDVRRRVVEFITELETKYRNKKILIVSHGDPLWLLDTTASGLTYKEINKVKNTKEGWYPRIGEIKQLKWQNIPRNEVGELDPHRPFVDKIIFKCDKCKAEMRRIPDLIDVWFDSGAMPFAQWHWPFENEKILKEQFPADFIAEAIDQTRGWFYTLVAISTLLDKGPPFRNVMSYGHVLDEKGQKMSKSKGNVLLPFDIIDKYGVDAARWYFYTVNTPAETKLFSEKDIKERLVGFMSTLQNCTRFYELYSRNTEGSVKIENPLDKWIMSRLNNVIQLATKKLDEYDPVTSARTIERFVVDDFSNWWLRRSRKRKESLCLLRMLLAEIAKLTAPFVPFISEDMHSRLNKESGQEKESVHLCNWPDIQKKFIDNKLEEEMTRLQEVVKNGLSLRKEKQIKVRQPLRSVSVVGKKFDKGLEDLIKAELNVKEVKYAWKGDMTFDTDITYDLAAEGYVRELMRQIQDMRKEAKYRFDEEVYCQWYSDNIDLSNAVFNWEDEIKRETVLSELVKLKHDKRAYDVEKELELAPGKKIWIGIKK